MNKNQWINKYSVRVLVKYKILVRFQKKIPEFSHPFEVVSNNRLELRGDIYIKNKRQSRASRDSNQKIEHGRPAKQCGNQWKEGVCQLF